MNKLKLLQSVMLLSLTLALGVSFTPANAMRSDEDDGASPAALPLARGSQPSDPEGSSRSSSASASSPAPQPLGSWYGGWASGITALPTMISETVWGAVAYWTASTAQSDGSASDPQREGPPKGRTTIAQPGDEEDSEAEETAEEKAAKKVADKAVRAATIARANAEIRTEQERERNLQSASAQPGSPQPGSLEDLVKQIMDQQGRQCTFFDIVTRYRSLTPQQELTHQRREEIQHIYDRLSRSRARVEEVGLDLLASSMETLAGPPPGSSLPHDGRVLFNPSKGFGPNIGTGS